MVMLESRHFHEVPGGPCLLDGPLRLHLGGPVGATVHLHHRAGAVASVTHVSVNEGEVSGRQCQ